MIGATQDNPMWKQKWLCLHNAHRIVCVSKRTWLDLFKAYDDIDESTVTWSHLGVSKTFRRKSGEDVQSLKNHLGIGNYFLMVGARGGYKNTELIIEALNLLDDPVTILATGWFPMEEHYKVPERHSIRTVKMADEQMAIAYSGALALLHPSYYEGFGMAQAEAISCGCPVITLDTGTASEVLGTAGHYLRQNSPQCLAQAMQGYLERAPDVRKKRMHPWRDWSHFANHLYNEILLTAVDAAWSETRYGKVE
jgi:glycosyltransferase involved in cell wall biosynthesis